MGIMELSSMGLVPLFSDLDVLHFFNDSSNVFIDQLAMVLTSGFTWVFLYVALFCVVVRNNETMGQIALVVGGALLCVLIATGVTDGIVKPSVARWRPVNDPAVKYLIHVVGGIHLKDYSFFSAHAANTMSLAVFFSLLIRSKTLAVALPLWSLLNCWTRLYLGVHYPSDIACGLLFGMVVGGGVYLLFRRLYRKISPDITYISTQYTSTGYDNDDIESILCVLVLTIVYAILRASIMTYYI